MFIHPSRSTETAIRQSDKIIKQTNNSEAISKKFPSFFQNEIKYISYLIAKNKGSIKPSNSCFNIQY